MSDGSIKLLIKHPGNANLRAALETLFAKLDAITDETASTWYDDELEDARAAWNEFEMKAAEQFERAR